MQRLYTRHRVSAAAILLIVITATYFLNRSTKKPVYDMATATQEQRSKNDVTPGGDKAKLTLADGKIITLDDVKNGRLAHQGNTTILKVDDGNSYRWYNSFSNPISQKCPKLFNGLSY